MKILLDKAKNECTLIFERRDKEREQLVSVRGLFDALCTSFGGYTDKQMHEIDEFMTIHPYKEIIERAESVQLKDDEAFEEFKTQPLDIKKIVIRRLYAVITCYCKDFTV